MVPIVYNRKNGDLIEIPGDYQFVAIYKGHPIQRAWHRQRIMAVMDNLKTKKDDVVLDVGCGSGVVTSKVAENVLKVFAIDSNKQAIRFARNRFSRLSNIEFRHCLADDIDFPKGTFDLILCLELIEHLTEIQVKHLLGTFLRILGPEGKVVISTPNYASHWLLIEKIMDFLKFAPTLQHKQHILRFTNKRLNSLLIDCGYKVDFLKSFLFIAPFVAFLGQNLSDKLFLWENRVALPWGCDLIAVATPL